MSEQTPAPRNPFHESYYRVEEAPSGATCSSGHTSLISAQASLEVMRESYPLRSFRIRNGFGEVVA